MSMRILGTGSYLPPKVVTNAAIAASLDTTDEWIYAHTGIRSRHVAEEGESTSTMAVNAARAAMDSAGVTSEEIGLIVLATSTPDFATFPSTACIVQDRIGCREAGAFDLQAACSGFVYGLEQARGFVNLHPDKKALVIGAECLTRILDWTDRSSCILFGDGAGAVVVGSCESAARITDAVILGADGSGGRYILRTGGTRDAPAVDPSTGIPLRGNPSSPTLMLQGHEVFAFAVRKLAEVVGDLCARQGITPESLDRIFAHQANRRIIEATARRMKIPLDRFWMNLETTANTSSASIPIALDEAVRTGMLRDGMKIVLAGFGSGLTWGGTYAIWPDF